MSQELLEYECPCCGGKIEFNSTIQKPQCPYCDTVFEPDALKGYDEALKREASDDMHWDAASDRQWSEEDGVAVYTCKSCAGQIVCDDTTAATACPYCGNPVVMVGKLAGDLKPDLIIPFRLDKNAAKEGLRRHLKGKRLLPKRFRDENRIDEIKGVYVPFWLFDADADASVRYRATRVRSWSDSRYHYTETSHYALLREGTVGFERVPADGSSKIENDLMESIEPYDFGEAVDFQTAYLSGFLADRYDVSSEACSQEVNQRIKQTAEKLLAGTAVGYATVIPQHSAVQCRAGKIRYALLPVWLLNTSWKGKTYSFAMNGQTGKFVGNLPVDRKAYWGWLGCLAVGITALAFLLLWCMATLGG